MPMSSPAHTPLARKKSFLVALGIVAFLAGLGALAASRAITTGRGPAAAVHRLSEAVHRHDAEGAMSFIDFDAVYTDAWRGSVTMLTGKTPSDQEIAAALARPEAINSKDLFRKNLIVFLSDPAKATGDTGAFFAALNALDAATVEPEGSEGATVRLPNDYSLTLALDDGAWKVVAFHGYEKDNDAYKKQADTMMKDKGLKPLSNDDPTPAPEAPPAQP